MTKSVAAFLMLPSLCVVLLLNGKFSQLLRRRSFYAGLMIMLSGITAYYAIREHFDPGYIKVVWQSEILRYTGHVMTWHEQPFLFYWQNIISRFNPYYSLLTLAVLIAYLFLPFKQYKLIVRNCLMASGVYLLVISIPGVKLEWYDAPLYPFMAIIIGISFCILIEQKTKISTLLFICAFSLPFYKVVSNNVSAPKGPAIGSFLRQIRSGAHKNDKIYIVNSNPDFSLFFYAKKDRLNGNDNTVVFPTDPMSHGSYIIINQIPRDIDVNNLYNLELVRMIIKLNYKAQELSNLLLRIFY